MEKNLTANARDTGSIPGLGRSSGGGHGNPLQYSCLGNAIDRGRLQSMGPERVGCDFETKTTIRSAVEALKGPRQHGW